MTLALATLVLVAQALVACTIAAWLLARVGRGRALDALTSLFRADHLRLAWLVAAVSMAGSLYMSEVRHFPPCPLCWYQRIAMYPLVLVLGIAAIRGEVLIRRYALSLCAVGATISIYHYQLERFPDQTAVACSAAVPCTTVWFTEFGYITIPMMALTGFTTIATILWLGARGERHG